MFKIGETIVYGPNGVFRIEDIRSSPFDEQDTRLYYVLKPVFGPESSTVYTLTENKNTVMRYLYSAEEIDAFIKKIPDIAPAEVGVEKQRRDVYRSIVSSTEPADYVKVIKAVHIRRQIFDKAKKHLPNTDSDYESLSRHRLQEEIAAVLGIDPETTGSYIKSLIGVELF